MTVENRVARNTARATIQHRMPRRAAQQAQGVILVCRVFERRHLQGVFGLRDDQLHRAAGHFEIDASIAKQFEMLA